MAKEGGGARGRSRGSGAFRFRAVGQRVTFTELGRKFYGTTRARVFDRTLTPEPDYLLDVSGRSIMKPESELSPA